jgi:uncharacterized membrane protein
MEPENNNQENAQEEVEVVSSEENGGNNAELHSEHKTFAILGYFLPFLFFLPLLDDKSKNDPFVKFHANQQLIELLILIGCHLVLQVLHIVILGTVVTLIYLFAAIFGAYYANKGNMKEIPLVGHFRVIK